MVERGHDVRVVRIVVLTLDGEDGNVVVTHEAGGHVVLRGERVRGAEGHVGSAIAEADHQICGLGGDVQAGRDADAFEGLVLDEFLADDLQDLHRLVGPLDALFAEIGQFEVLNVAAYWCGCHFSPWIQSQKSEVRLNEVTPWTPAFVVLLELVEVAE